MRRCATEAGANRGTNRDDGHLVDSFLEMMSAERGAGANTLQAYARDLETYGQFLARKGIKAADATTADIRAWLADVKAGGHAGSTQARRLSAVRQFHRFLYGEGIAIADPAAIIEAPRRARPLPKTLSLAKSTGCSPPRATAQRAPPPPPQAGRRGCGRCGSTA
jgi:integrase/recombinase XerD